MTSRRPPYVVVGFGASSVQGARDSAGGFIARAAKVTAPNHPHIHWINRGVGGNRTTDMLLRAGEVKQDKPTHLIVMLGCNDMPRTSDGCPETRVSLEQYESNLNQILPTIRAPRSLFVSSFVVCPNRTGVSERDFARYMEVAMSTASRHGYEIWDLYRETKTTISRYWSDDGLHLADEGHQFIADSLLRWLNVTATLQSRK